MIRSLLRSEQASFLIKTRLKSTLSFATQIPVHEPWPWFYDLARCASRRKPNYWPISRYTSPTARFFHQAHCESLLQARELWSKIPWRRVKLSDKIRSIQRFTRWQALFEVGFGGLWYFITCPQRLISLGLFHRGWYPVLSTIGEWKRPRQKASQATCYLMRTTVWASQQLELTIWRVEIRNFTSFSHTSFPPNKCRSFLLSNRCNSLG